jgi:hypothetical protein
MTLRFIKNSKLSDELLLDGYLFQRKTSKPNQPIIWRCREYRVIQDRCPAACKTENGQLIKQWGAHNHQAPSNASIEMKDAVVNMKKRSREEDIPMQQIFNQEISKKIKLGADIVEVAKCQVHYNNYKNTLFKIRRQDTPNLPKTHQQIILTIPYTITNYNQRYLLFDTGILRKDRIIAFASDAGLRLLGLSSQWHCDGTFKSAPKFFYQNYSIHAWYMGEMYYCFHAYMMNKTYASYVELLNNIIAQCTSRNIRLDPKVS